MKKLTLFFVMIPLLSGISMAQLQMPPYQWDPFQKWRPGQKSSSFVLHKKSPCEVGKMLAFEQAYSVVEVPHLSWRRSYFPETGPLLIVRFNSREYEMWKLAGSNLDANQIKSVTVLKDSTAHQKYGCRGRNGAVIIELKKDHGVRSYRLENGRIVKFIDRIEVCEPPYKRKWVQ